MHWLQKAVAKALYFQTVRGRAGSARTRFDSMTKAVQRLASDPCMSGFAAAHGAEALDHGESSTRRAPLI
jgi:hypothetical protein